jgi:hypothetical protein
VRKSEFAGRAGMWRGNTAQGAMGVLDGEMRVIVAEGMEMLRSRGEYREYRQGEAYDKIEGVLTAGEPTDQGVRMFAFTPETFPDLYSKRAERTEVARSAVRKVLGMVERGGKEGS